MAKAGLPHLNLATKSISIKSSASSSLSGAQRSGVSFGIRAQRSNTSIFNTKIAYSEETSALRHRLNSKTVINNNMPVHAQKQDSGMSTMDKLMMISMMGTMATKFGTTIADAIKEIKGSKTDKTDKTDKPSNTPNTPDSPSVDSSTTPTTLNGKLKASKSFKDVSNLENEMNAKLDGFGAGYKEALDGVKNEINTTLNDANIQKALQEAGANIDINSLPTGADINITKDSDTAAFEKAEKSIDADIDKVSNFESKQLEPAVNKLSKKSGELKGSIDALEIQIGQIENLPQNSPERQKLQGLREKKAQLEEQKKNIDEAKSKLEQEIPGKLKQLTSDLKAKKKELDDLKDTKEDIADKKFNLVKENDEQITKNKKAMDKLAGEIDKLKQATGDKYDAKEINKKIKEYNDYVVSTSNLVSSLEGAPAEVKNAKGKSHRIANSSVDSKYTTMVDYVDANINDRGSASAAKNGVYYRTPNATNPLGNDGLGGSGSMKSSVPKAEDYVKMATVNGLESQIGQKGMAMYNGYTISKLGNEYVVTGFTANRSNPNGTQTFQTVGEAVKYIDTPEYMRNFQLNMD